MWELPNCPPTSSCSAEKWGGSDSAQTFVSQIIWSLCRTVAATGNICDAIHDCSFWLILSNSEGFEKKAVQGMQALFCQCCCGHQTSSKTTNISRCKPISNNNLVEVIEAFREVKAGPLKCRWKSMRIRMFKRMGFSILLCSEICRVTGEGDNSWAL